MLLGCGALMLGGCSAEDLVLPDGDAQESSPYGKDVYSLGFTVTLDNMGTRAGAPNGDPDEVTRWENYINLERFRVLFFDKDDLFLFESKNRWVKQTEGGNSFSSWFVSVPFGPYGNDSYGEGYEYDWEKIRNILTSQEFKIVIMANRPPQLLYPGNFADSELQLPGGVFDNDGPYWGPSDFRQKSIFDLHHYQYDIIYADKGSHSTTAYYDFIMGNIKTDRPTMGAAINWVSFDNGDTDKVSLGDVSKGKYMRNLKMPSQDHPIPMYGVQKFPAIPPSSWLPGTTFDISIQPDGVYPETPYEGRQAISLLRSCVRLDLKIPKSVKGGKQPTHISLWYSNIYSRTEPMDNWTPTNELWNHNGEPHSDSNCELTLLRKHGNVINKLGLTNSKQTYQDLIKWFYTAWKEKGWDFYRIDDTKNAPPDVDEFPRIMNSCIQRNQFITLQNGNYTNYFSDANSYWHYVVYTGERNPNDPNTFTELNKNPYIAFFAISWDNTNYYMVPLFDYQAISTDKSTISSLFGPHSDGSIGNASAPTAYNNFITNTLPTRSGGDIPYPLLRNHIYTFTLTGTKAGGDELDPTMIMSDVRASDNINFSRELQSTHRPVIPNQTLPAAPIK